jgi:hypothetical protein
MFVITKVDIASYGSRIVPESLLVDHLLGTECSGKGVLKIVLKPGWNLVQHGPMMHPPIRWVRSFERDAVFEAVCTVEQISQDE